MNKRVLVVDDDPDILDAVQLMLEDVGYRVKTCEKGDHADNLSDEDGDMPDVIILDVLLSGRDGRTICRNLKARTETRHIPIIMISAHPNAEASALNVGADDFVSKPFDIDALLDRVARFAPTEP